MFEDFEDDGAFEEEMLEEAPSGEEGEGGGGLQGLLDQIRGNPVYLGGAILVAVIIIGSLCGIFYMMMGNGSNGGADIRNTEIAQALEQQTQVALFIQQTEIAMAWTSTAPPTDVPTATNTQAPVATRTPVLAPTNTPLAEATQNPSTATVAALLTQAAEATLIPTSTLFPSTALPDTGFGDGALGIPELMGLAALAVMLIFLVRRLRTAAS